MSAFELTTIERFAANLADALPNANRIGFTGTPISLAGADTAGDFGELIHTYDIKQVQEDKATVPIYDAPRQIKQHLAKTDLDELAQGHLVNDPERRKGRWGALATDLCGV